MSFNGAGVFVINSAGQPVVFNTIISETVFNALTADLATGLSNCVTRDGQSPATADIPMGGFTLTGLGAGAAAGESIRYEQWIAAHPLQICEFRLTLTTGTPVTTADVVDVTPLYMTPYKGNRIALYNGTNWNVRTSAQISVAGGLTASKVYDVFCYDNGGTPTLELLAWTNDTTRATALTTQDGVLVKTGALTRRYLGTIRTNLSGNFVDGMANRWVWNYYNRILRPMRVLEATDSWNYTTATIRQANNAATNQLDFVIGVSEDVVSANLMFAASNDTGGLGVSAAIGLDTTTAYTAGQLYASLTIIAAETGQVRFGSAQIKLYPGVGRHYLSWNEVSGATGTTTWYGDQGGANQSGIHGEVWC